MLEKSKRAGYKCPPVSNQWQKGQSGNPSGKKKKAKMQAPAQPLLECIAANLCTPVEIIVKGNVIITSRANAIAMKVVHNLMLQPLKCQLEALKSLAKLGVFEQEALRIAEESDDTVYFTEEHRRILAIIAESSMPSD